MNYQPIIHQHQLMPSNHRKPQLKPSQLKFERDSKAESESKDLFFQDRVSNSLKKGFPTHQRSSSLSSKNRKFRLQTQQNEKYSKNQIKFYSKYFQPLLKPHRKNDTYAINLENISQNRSQSRVIHSTKNNTSKNAQLRSLFKDESKSKRTYKVSNHPLLKFAKNKTKKQTRKSNFKQYHSHSSGKSAYIQQAENIDGIRGKTKTDKRDHCKPISVRKDEIKLKINPRNHNEQSTVKTIKKQKEDLEIQLKNQEESSVEEGYGLTEEEEQTFGDRFPYGFQKVKLLGRGGFSLVWLGRHIKSGKQFAIKQIITQNTHQTHIKQIWFGTMFFTLGGVVKPQFAQYLGVKNLVRLYSYEINQTDTWIFYEKCGKSLGSTLYDINSQRVFGDQRLYKIHYKPIYKMMASNSSILNRIILEICKVLQLISDCEIVHSDLKTQNILIKYDQENNFNIIDVKLIDYGSSFDFNNIAQFSMATPQYMPPQILNYIIHQNQGQYQHQLYQQVMHNYNNPSSIDMWSLGCVLLQIVIGIPLWMSLPILVPSKNNNSYLQKEGLFAVKGRLFPQIIKKQRAVISKLPQILETQNYSKIVLSDRVKDIIIGMLRIDFNARIRPSEVIAIIQKELQLPN